MKKNLEKIKNQSAPTREGGLQWTRVEDGLPELKQIVDTWNGKSNRRSQYLRIGHESNEAHFYRHIDAIKGDRLGMPYYPDITHWMPLPTPPESKTEGREGEQEDGRNEEIMGRREDDLINKK